MLSIMEVYPGPHNLNARKVAVDLHDEQSPRVTTDAPSVPPGFDRPPHTWSTGRLLSAVARRIERDWNARLAHWDLNHASLPVLFLLAGGPRSQRELALASGVTEQTMSRILTRLERQDYVVRRTHDGDRRRHEVTLTDSGRLALVEAGDPDVAEAMAIRGLTTEQVAPLRELLLAMLAERPGAGRAIEEALGEDRSAADTEPLATEQGGAHA